MPRSPVPIPLAPGVFAGPPTAAPSTWRLRAARHRATGRIRFPAQDGQDWEEIALPREGRLWSFTVQRFRPKSPPYRGPEKFEPFALGYVELPEFLIVESRLVGIPFDRLVIGMPLVLTVEPLRFADGGDTRLSFAFTSPGGVHD